MDYLVFGVGFGATLVLVGWILRQYGPLLRFRDSSDDVLSAEQLLERNDWQRFCVALGALLSVGGAVMLLATLVTMLIHPSDNAGTMIVGIIFALSLIAVAGWIVMYVNQHRALAGDRRREAVEESNARRTTGIRKTAPDPESHADDIPTTAPKPTTTSSQGEPSRRRAPQGTESARAAAPRPEPARTPETTATTAPPTTRGSRQPATQSPAQGGQPSSTAQPSATRPVREVTAEATVPETHAGSPNPTLRNVQFKRTAANRAQQERRPAPTPARTLKEEPGTDERG